MAEKKKLQTAEYGHSIYLDPGDSWACPCGKETPLSFWVAAHWDIRMNHTCEDCGTKRNLKSGRLTTPKKKKGKK